MSYTKSLTAFLAAVSVSLSLSTFPVYATGSTSTIVTSNANGSYKDSFYFVDNGTKYLAVSNLSLPSGGISILKSYQGSDTDYRPYVNVISGNYWAPALLPTTLEGIFIVMTTHFESSQLSESYLEYFLYDVRNKVFVSAPSLVPFLGYDGKGMIDVTIWYEASQNDELYLIGSRWEDGVDGSRLQWSKWIYTTPSFFTAPVDLYDTPNVSGSQYRIDRNRTDIHSVVEAPIWSFWDHTNDGHHELYWSIGHSSPCNPTSTIRRGDLNFEQNGTPWVYVFNDDMTSTNMTPCGNSFLTHPDFTENGNIRATSHDGSQFVIVNQSTW